MFYPPDPKCLDLDKSESSRICIPENRADIQLGFHLLGGFLPFQPELEAPECPTLSFLEKVQDEALVFRSQSCLGVIPWGSLLQMKVKLCIRQDG
jgi:hypothetical protein